VLKSIVIFLREKRFLREQACVNARKIMNWEKSYYFVSHFIMKRQTVNTAHPVLAKYNQISKTQFDLHHILVFQLQLSFLIWIWNAVAQCLCRFCCDDIGKSCVKIRVSPQNNLPVGRFNRKITTIENIFYFIWRDIHPKIAFKDFELNQIDW
jgi:hypothetical protein